MGAGSAATVLIVDDDRALRIALESVLAPLGYRILSTGSGDAAYSLLVDNPADAVLLDVHLPLISGPALYLAIISRWPQLEGRIAMMTGDAGVSEVRPWLEQRQCVVFQKPFGLSRIADWLASALSERNRKTAGGGQR